MFAMYTNIHKQTHKCDLWDTVIDGLGKVLCLYKDSFLKRLKIKKP